ncbi:MAG: hypothetical protein DRN27_07285 [Thermoplasmata archaeon]|nr:MAG: hypothetical protein DRN27_07285 [Thermoplasmata archaeon]
MNKIITLTLLLILILPSINLMTTAKQNETYDYVIITTNKIQEGSIKLDDFIQHKENLGFSVLIVTEDEFNNVQGEPPNKRPEKIRQWLINNYETMGIKYVLLIGDPVPETYLWLGFFKQLFVKDYSIPMKVVRDFDVSFHEFPTDFYYADLDDWNYNNNRMHGDVEDYEHMDLVPEIYVGRIPVYGTNPFYKYDLSTVDHILEKIINYENEKNPTWRKNILLPMSFTRIGVEIGTHLAEQMLDDFLIPRGFSYWRMYQQGTDYATENSIYDSEEELLDDAVVNRWKDNPYGLVCWMGHGGPEWVRIGNDLHNGGTLFNANQIPLLNDSQPSIVFMISCQNGFPENHYNLGYSLLKQGAIATISGARTVGGGLNNTYGDFETCGTSTGIAYRLLNYTSQNYPLGEALCLVKAELYPDSWFDADELSDVGKMMWKKELFVFNLYGDPSLRLMGN